MRFLCSQKQTGRLGTASATLTVAAILLATAFAVPAAAETTNSLAGAVASATEGAAPIEKAPAASAEEVQPAPIEEVETPGPTPEPVEVQGAPGGADPTGTGPVESSATVPSPSTSSASSASLPDQPVSTPPPEVPALAKTERGAAVATVTERSPDLTGGVRRASAKTVAPVIAQTTQAVSVQAPLETAHSTLRNASAVAPELLSQATMPVREALDFVTSSVTEVASSVAEGLLPSALEQVAVGSGPPASPNEPRSSTGPELASRLAAERAIDVPENSSLAKYPGAFGGIEPLRPETPDGSASSASSSLQAMPAAVDVYLSSVTGGGPSGPSPDRPAPPFGSPGATTGSGSSSFVPLAALLALLALVAPATFRRRREVPDFLAPTPFVCALERPG